MLTPRSMEKRKGLGRSSTDASRGWRANSPAKELAALRGELDKLTLPVRELQEKLEKKK